MISIKCLGLQGQGTVATFGYKKRKASERALIQEQCLRHWAKQGVHMCLHPQELEKPYSMEAETHAKLMEELYGKNWKTEFLITESNS